MSTKKVAELLVETLALAGVQRISGVAGDSLNGITDTLRKLDDIRWAPVRMKRPRPSPPAPRRT